MVVVGVLQPVGILEDFPHAGDELVEKLPPLSVVEQRAADGGDLHETREGERRQCGGEGGVEVEE